LGQSGPPLATVTGYVDAEYHANFGKYSYDYQVPLRSYDAAGGNYLSVRWSPDGRRLLTGDRRGRISEWSFDPDHDLWDANTIAAFAKLSWKHAYTTLLVRRLTPSLFSSS
jgi:WD40 repeat protein